MADDPADTTSGAAAGLFVLTLDVGLAIRVERHSQPHGMAADGAVFDVVLVRARRDVHGHDDLFAARVADVRGIGVR